MSKPPVTLGDIGEFETIARIRRWLDDAGTAQGERPAHRASSVRVGPGDDVAVTVPPPGHELLLTTDVQLAGRHFVPAWMTGEEIGRRALEVNLSDIAAMGGSVLWVLVSLGLPSGFRLDHLEQIYRGMLAGLAEAGEGCIVGGNLASTPDGSWFLDLTVVGAAPHGLSTRRGGAKPDDRIFVTGAPGESAAGLSVLRAATRGASDRGIGSQLHAREALTRTHPLLHRWVEAFLRPRSRLGLGRALGEGGHVSAMVDVSDGVLGDLHHICTTSGVGAFLELDELAFPDLPPLPDGLEAAGTAPPWDWILGPSDDYELLFTAPESQRDPILDLARRHGLVVRELGGIVKDDTPRILLQGGGTGRPSGEWRPAEGCGGWDHFAPPST